MQDTFPVFRAFVLTLTMLALAGCSGSRFEWPGSSAAPETALPVAPSAPPVNLSGRWLLSSPGRGQCHMTFGSATSNGVEGTIAPEGGCPGKFFTSRKWTYSQAGLTMRDHTGQPLAQLSREGPGFQGTATSGEPVALMR
jgi:hypothetical protein